MAENLAQSVDGNLNRQSRALLEALRAATGKFSMFGHQNETSKVITPDTDSDVHAVTGAYPAVWGNDSGAAGTGAYGTPLPESPMRAISTLSRATASYAWPIRCHVCTRGKYMCAV